MHETCASARSCHTLALQRAHLQLLHRGFCLCQALMQLARLAAAPLQLRRRVRFARPCCAHVLAGLVQLLPQLRKHASVALVLWRRPRLRRLHRRAQLRVRLVARIPQLLCVLRARSREVGTNTLRSLPPVRPCRAAVRPRAVFRARRRAHAVCRHATCVRGPCAAALRCGRSRRTLRPRAPQLLLQARHARQQEREALLLPRPRQAQALCELRREGCSVREVCGEAGIAGAELGAWRLGCLERARGERVACRCRCPQAHCIDVS